MKNCIEQITCFFFKRDDYEKLDRLLQNKVNLVVISNLLGIVIISSYCLKNIIKNYYVVMPIHLIMIGMFAMGLVLLRLTAQLQMTIRIAILACMLNFFFVFYLTGDLLRLIPWWGLIPVVTVLVFENKYEIFTWNVIACFINFSVGWWTGIMEFTNFATTLVLVTVAYTLFAYLYYYSNVYLIRDLKSAQDTIQNNQSQLIEMADSVLHNAGNILNSVVTSSEIIKDRLRSSVLEQFKKANDLLKENRENLDHLLRSDPMGKNLLDYYIHLESGFNQENNELRTEISRVMTKVDLIKNVVVAQQAHASGFAYIEKISLRKIIEDVLIIQENSIRRNKIKVRKQFDQLPAVTIQRSKLMHIIINLYNNAKESFIDGNVEDRLLLISLSRKGTSAILKFSDNGGGITKEALKKLFTYGYTTKSQGHGFGLHSCCNYMLEMGGRMWAESNGPGQGATFFLEFPLSDFQD